MNPNLIYQRDVVTSGIAHQMFCYYTKKALTERKTVIVEFYRYLDHGGSEFIRGIAMVADEYDKRAADIKTNAEGADIRLEIYDGRALFKR